MSSNPTDALTTSLTALVTLSVATERVTQIAKQWLTGTSWLTPKGQPPPVFVTHLIAFVSGVLVAVLSGQNPIGYPKFVTFENWAQWGAWAKSDWISWLLSGILISGGSAFWNHALDFVKAAKVQKEQAVNSTLSTINARTIPQ